VREVSNDKTLDCILDTSGRKVEISIDPTRHPFEVASSRTHLITDKLAAHRIVVASTATKSDAIRLFHRGSALLGSINAAAMSEWPCNAHILLVRDPAGDFIPATPEMVLRAAKTHLNRRVRRGATHQS